MRVLCHLMVLDLVFALVWYCGEASHVKQQSQTTVEMEMPLIPPRVEMPALPVWERHTPDMDATPVRPDLTNRVMLHLRIKRHHC